MSERISKPLCVYARVCTCVCARARDGFSPACNECVLWVLLAALLLLCLKSMKYSELKHPQVPVNIFYAQGQVLNHWT